MRDATRQAQIANRKAMKEAGEVEPKVEDFPISMRIAIRNMNRRR